MSTMPFDRNDVERFTVNVPWWMSWPAIIITLFIFWPIAIFLLWKRALMDRTAAMIAGRLLTVLGSFILIITIPGYMISMTEGYQNVDGKATVMIFVTAFALLFFGWRFVRNAKQMKQYIHLIVNEREDSIDRIASLMSISYKEVERDLQNMIDSGYFSYSHIDKFKRRIVVPGLELTPDMSSFDGIPNEDIEESKEENKKNQDNNELSVVKCKNCGANNEIHGKKGICQYCGSVIKVKKKKSVSKS